jgi:membrane associated rhomboid family serine protease
MFPIRDNLPSQKTPFVNYTLIILTAIVFLVQLGTRDPEEPSLAEMYGMIPARVVRPGEPVEVSKMEVVDGERRKVGTRPAADPPIHPWFTLVTSVFLHGGLIHLLGNMWILYVFGDNIEDRFGHFGYLLFYLGCGMVAAMAHLVTTPLSNVPTIGASGAVAGVMGGYFLLYPRATVLAIVPPFFPVILPAAVFLGLWLLFQILLGVLTITATDTAGVAWWAHVGGFLVGAGTAWILHRTNRLHPDAGRRIPDSDRHLDLPFRRWKPPEEQT